MQTYQKPTLSRSQKGFFWNYYWSAWEAHKDSKFDLDTNFFWQTRNMSEKYFSFDVQIIGITHWKNWAMEEQIIQKPQYLK